MSSLKSIIPTREQSFSPTRLDFCPRYSKRCAHLRTSRCVETIDPQSTVPVKPLTRCAGITVEVICDASSLDFFLPAKNFGRFPGKSRTSKSGLDFLTSKTIDNLIWKTFFKICIALFRPDSTHSLDLSDIQNNMICFLSNIPRILQIIRNSDNTSMTFSKSGYLFDM